MHTGSWYFWRTISKIDHKISVGENDSIPKNGMSIMQKFISKMVSKRKCDNRFRSFCHALHVTYTKYDFTVHAVYFE